jgi:hypothetical protein
MFKASRVGSGRINRRFPKLRLIIQLTNLFCRVIHIYAITFFLCLFQYYMKFLSVVNFIPLVLKSGLSSARSGLINFVNQPNSIDYFKDIHNYGKSCKESYVILLVAAPTKFCNCTRLCRKLAADSFFNCSDLIWPKLPTVAVRLCPSSLISIFVLVVGNSVVQISILFPWDRWWRQGRKW